MLFNLIGGSVTFAASLLLAISIPHGYASAESACRGQVTVTAGDSLSNIAARCDSTIGAVLRVNPEIEDPNAIYVGQVIHLPVDLASDIIAVEQAATEYGLCILHATTGFVEIDIRHAQQQSDGKVLLDRDDIVGSAFLSCRQFRIDLNALLESAEQSDVMNKVIESLRNAALEIVDGVSEDL